MDQKLLKVRKVLLYAVALIWFVFQVICCFKAGIGVIALRGCHTAFAMSLVFLMKPLATKRDSVPTFVLDLICTLFLLYIAWFYWAECTRLMNRFLFISPLTDIDLVLGIFFVLLLLECCRRMLGNAMLIVTLVFIAYALFGKGLPGIFAHLGVSWQSFIEMQFMATYGVLGTAAGVSANTVFYFMIFGAFLAGTPAGKLFISLARFVTRKTDGGDGKTMIIACGLFGMISGSAAANVASVGALTYDSMTDAGFDPVFSASTLAIAGSGGQLIPPVMGSAAFLMADYIGLSYWKICLYAILPSVLYVLSLYFVVHFEAKRRGIRTKAMETSELLKQIKSYAYLLIPLILLVYLIAVGKTVRTSAMYASILLVVLTSIKKESRLSIKTFIDTVVDGTKSACVVAIPCAVAGIIVGILSYTSLGLRLSSLISELAGTSLLVALLLSMVLVIIMGMGMPTSAAYIMSATLLASAISKLGVDLIVVHFFIFYFANLSMITPPVALASYTAAGLAKTPFWETGIQAFKYSFVVFLIPFCFIYNPALLGLGAPPEILWAFVPSALGVFAVGMAIVGFYRGLLGTPLRIALGLLGLMTIVPETISTLLGMAGILVIIVQRVMHGKKAEPASP